MVCVVCVCGVCVGGWVGVGVCVWCVVYVVHALQSVSFSLAWRSLANRVN